MPPAVFELYQQQALLFADPFGIGVILVVRGDEYRGLKQLARQDDVEFLYLFCQQPMVDMHQAV